MILILGATGYVGQAFIAELHHRKQAYVALSRQSLDYTRFDVLFNYVRNAKPRLIINAAGCTGRPTEAACDNARADAVQGNTLLPQTVSRVSFLTKIPWAHISSGSIFSGGKVAENGSFRLEPILNKPELLSTFAAHPENIRGFSEDDRPNCSFDAPPCSFYSGTKALGEESLHWLDQGYIWRPGLMFDEAEHPRNLLFRMRCGAPAPGGINSLSHRGDFVRGCLNLWDRNVPYGIYHVANRGAITAAQLIDIWQRLRHPATRMDFHEAERSNGAISPNCSILDSSKLLSAGIELRSVTDALTESLQRWQQTAHTGLLTPP